MKRKINILEISSRSDIGGGPEQLFKVVSNLEDRFRFYCACPDQEPYFKKIANEGIPVFKLPYRRFAVLSFFRLARWTRVNRISVIHSHGRGAGVYARLLKGFNMKLEIVHTFHGIHFHRMTFTWVAEKLLSMLTNKFVFVSESERQIALQHGLASISKSVLIENGISLDNKKYLGDKQSRVLRIPGKTISPDSFVIGMLSRFDSIKNIPYAIRALSDYLKNHNDVFIIIGGDGEERGKIEFEIQQSGLLNKVILLGYIYDIQQFYQSIDVYLNTSAGEAFGLSTVEAMKYGKPVIVSKVSGNIDIVDGNNTGLFFQLDEPSMIIEKIEILRNDKEVYDRLSRNALETVKKRFDLCQMLRKTGELYTSLVPDLSVSERIRVGINTGVGRYTSNVCMKIAIDTRMIGPFVHGISRYAYGLIKVISEIDKKNNYLLISNNNYLEDFVSCRDNFELLINNSRLYGISEQFHIPKILREEGVDVFHSPSYFGPVYGSCRKVMTIHDIVPLLFPQKYSIFHKLYYHTIVRKAAKSARKIITVSENSRNDINKYLGISLDKIVVTHNAVDEKFNLYRADKVNSIKSRYGINGRYLLYVGNQKPHKNVVQLIRAYNLLKGRTKHQLIIVGKEERSTRRCLPGELLEGVVFTGEVSDDNLSCLYSGADLYVSASLYEGFGLPFLEAMACGTPIVALKMPSLYEVVGDACYIVEENSPEGFADAICNILSDVNKQRSLIENGFKRVQMYSWKKTAIRTLEVYEEVSRA